MICTCLFVTTLPWTILQPAPPSAPASRPTATSRPTTVPSSAPAVNPSDVEQLIRRLGDTDYHVRRAAHDALIALGDAAVDALLAHLSDPDHEIAGRVSAILPTPVDPELRARVAVRLIETGRLDLLRKAVDILFDDPETALEPFRKRATDPSAHRYVRMLAPDIVRSLEDWIGFAQIGRRLIAAAQGRDDAEAVAQHRNHIEEQRRSLKTVAYLYSEATLVEHLAGSAEPPSDQPRSAASQPATAQSDGAIP